MRKGSAQSPASTKSEATVRAVQAAAQLVVQPSERAALKCIKSKFSFSIGLAPNWQIANI